MWLKDPDPGDPKRPDPDPQHWLKGLLTNFYTTEDTTIYFEVFKLFKLVF